MFLKELSVKNKFRVPFFYFFLFSFSFRIPLISADSTVVRKICKSATLIEYSLNGPIALQELILNLDSIKVNSVLAHNYLGNGGEKTSKMFTRIFKEKPNLFAAINGDFFGGKPHRIINSMVMNGEIVKGVNIGRSQFAITNTGKPLIGIFGFRGEIFCKNFSFKIFSFNDSKKLPSVFNYFFNKLFCKDSLKNGIVFKTLKKVTVGDTIPLIIERFSAGYFKDTLKKNELFLSLNSSEQKETLPNLEKGDTLFFTSSFDSSNTKITTLVGGLPALLRNGDSIKNFIGVENLHSHWFVGKNPRTAIGFDKNGKRLFVVTVDGRQAGYSIGMTLAELSEFLKKEGAYKALNLDGGGSTTMVINGVIVNSPSDSTGERPVHNGLLFFKNKR